MSKRLKIIIISNQRGIFEEIKNETEDSDLDAELSYIEESSFNKSVDIRSDIVIFAGSEKIAPGVADFCNKNRINLVDYSAPVPETMMLYDIYRVFSEFSPEYFSANLMFSASYYGEEGVAELTSQTISLFNQGLMENSVFPKRIAFNIIPGLGRIMDDGKTIIESGMESLFSRMVSSQKLTVSISTVIVPVIAGLAAVISLKTNDECKMSRMVKAFEDSDKFIFYPGPNNFPTVLDLEKDKIHIGRLRSCGNGYFSLFAIADNIKTLRVRPIVEKIKAG
jgi:aspartate-semialdehyde dehydrogenase